MAEAEQGRRFKQIVNSFEEKTSVYSSYCYQITYEREV